MKKKIWLSVPLLIAMTSCQTSRKAPSENEINSFFDKAFEERLAISPQSQTRLGIKKDYNKLDDYSEEQDQRELMLAKRLLAKLKSYNFEALNPADRLSYRLFEERLKQEIDGYKFRHHSYPVNQMFGIQSALPSFMINMHRIDELSDAEAYIARLSEFNRVFQQVLAGLKLREQKGIIAPHFVYEKAIRDSRNIIQGFPFTPDSKPSTLYEDFSSKLDALKLSEDSRLALLKRCEQALLSSVQPAYQQLIEYLTVLEKKAPKQASASALPNGKAYYQYQLRRYTTTDLSPETIHNMGLQEVARIRQEMTRIKDVVGFKGDLKAFFTHMATQPQFYFPQTQAGREAYLAESRKIMEQFKKRLPEVFGILPKADVEVRAVESFREQSAGRAFYNAPAMDGSRPGIFYVNLYDMSRVPKYELEALTYHESIPGHHLQIAISQELEGLPKFRRFAGNSAYSEGWGLYSELLPKEMGFYQDPYSDFGRLSMELWRACRLVVDSGIHWKGWTREQAIQYLQDHTPASDSEIQAAVERYIVMPGQATAYKVGSMRILELREKARQALADGFSLADFHDQILKNGPLPLDILEEHIEQWLAASSKKLSLRN